MNPIDMLHQKEVSLLEAIHRTPAASQRVLSTGLGMSLGQTNAFIKTLVDKGDLEIVSNNNRQTKYAITKRGYARWIRYTNLRLTQSYRHVCDVKRIVGKLFDDFAERGFKEFVMDGENEAIAAIIGEVFRDTIGDQGKLIWGTSKSKKEQILLRLNAMEKSDDENVVHLLYEVANAS